MGFGRSRGVTLNGCAVELHDVAEAVESAPSSFDDLETCLEDMFRGIGEVSRHAGPENFERDGKEPRQKITNPANLLRQQTQPTSLMRTTDRSTIDTQGTLFLKYVTSFHRSMTTTRRTKSMRRKAVLGMKSSNLPRHHKRAYHALSVTLCCMTARIVRSSVLLESVPARRVNVPLHLLVFGNAYMIVEMNPGLSNSRLCPFLLVTLIDSVAVSMCRLHS